MVRLITDKAYIEVKTNITYRTYGEPMCEYELVLSTKDKSVIDRVLEAMEGDKND